LGLRKRSIRSAIKAFSGIFGAAILRWEWYPEDKSHVAKPPIQGEKQADEGNSLS
jgi:hypothetical protein